MWLIAPVSIIEIYSDVFIWFHKLILIIFKIILRIYCCCCSVANSWHPLRPHAGLFGPPLAPKVCSHHEWMMLFNHLSLCRLLLLLPSIFPSIKGFSSESVLCIRLLKYWSFTFSLSPSKEYSGLISFKIDWFDLPAVQGILKSLLQPHDSKA